MHSKPSACVPTLTATPTPAPTPTCGVYAANEDTFYHTKICSAGFLPVWILHV